MKNYDQTTKKKPYCVKHQKYCRPVTGSWRLADNGWECSDIHVPFPEFTTQKIKAERQEYLKSQIQSHRQGELSKEFVQLYPERIKEMKKAGVVTEKEIKKAKPVWQDLPGIANVARTK